jgi:hypothetical protein
MTISKDLLETVPKVFNKPIFLYPLPVLIVKVVYERPTSFRPVSRPGRLMTDGLTTKKTSGRDVFVGKQSLLKGSFFSQVVINYPMIIRHERFEYHPPFFGIKVFPKSQVSPFKEPANKRELLMFRNLPQI